MRFVATAALLLMALSFISAKIPNTPVILCGRQLADARLIVCYGSEYVKRGSPLQYSLDNIAGDGVVDQEWPWSGRQGALAASWTRYKRQGLADECCLKPCTTDVILNYC